MNLSFETVEKVGPGSRKLPITAADVRAQVGTGANRVLFATLRDEGGVLDMPVGGGADAREKMWTFEKV